MIQAQKHISYKLKAFVSFLPLIFLISLTHSALHSQLLLELSISIFV